MIGICFYITRASSVGASAGVSVYPVFERKGGWPAFDPKSCFFRCFLEGLLDGSVFTPWATFWRLLERLQVGAMLVPRMDKKWVRTSIEIRVLLGTVYFTILCLILDHSGG